jgi:TonB family protein
MQLLTKTMTHIFLSICLFFLVLISVPVEAQVAGSDRVEHDNTVQPDRPPAPVGGEEVYFHWMNDNISCLYSDQREKVQGTVDFLVQADGKVKFRNCVANVPDRYCLAEIKAAIEAMDFWEPAHLLGEPVAQQVTRTLEFDIDTVQAIVATDVFYIVEDVPEYPGGVAALMDFFAEHIVYPQAAKEAGMEGHVYVSLVVAPDGSVSDAKVLRDIGGGCGKEALRVVEQMPNWIPGRDHGEPVHMKVNFPVRFRIE